MLRTRTIISIFPSVLVAIILSCYFWNTPPQSDGWLVFDHAKTIAEQPISIANFTEGLHEYSFVSLILLSICHNITYLEPVNALRLLQLALFVLGITYFYKICSSLSPEMFEIEKALLTLCFAVTPIVLVSLIGVSLDFIAMNFMLAFIHSIINDRKILAALSGTLMAFSKETSLFVYLILLLPNLYLQSKYNVIDACRKTRKVLGATPLMLPVFFIILVSLVRKGTGIDTVLNSNHCGNSLVGFLTSSNIFTPSVQSYLFNLFALNFHWILTVIVILGIFRLSFGQVPVSVLLTKLIHDRAWLVVSIFFIAWMYTFSRCPTYNSPKYVLNAVPLYLLLFSGFNRLVFKGFAHRLLILCVVIMSLTSSIFYTRDPVSRFFYGTFLDGSMERLCMAGRISPERRPFCGNDELLYNLQAFTP